MAQQPPSPNSQDESFPELEAFQEEERKRHKRLILQVLLGSLGLLAGGITILLLVNDEADWKYIPAGILMVCIGTLGVARALFSLFTDIDTRDRDLWDGVIGTEDEMRAEMRDHEKGEDL